jgi:hypothetical protein
MTAHDDQHQLFVEADETRFTAELPLQLRNALLKLRSACSKK